MPPRIAPPQTPVPGSVCSAQADLGSRCSSVHKLRSASEFAKTTPGTIFVLLKWFYWLRGNATATGGLSYRVVNQRKATGAGGERRQGLVRIAPSALLPVYPVARDHHADRRKPCTGRGLCPRVCSCGCTRCGTLRRTRTKCTACLLLTLRADGACARAQVSVKDCLQPRATGRANPRHVGTARCIRDGGRQERASQAVSAQ